MRIYICDLCKKQCDNEFAIHWLHLESHFYDGISVGIGEFCKECTDCILDKVKEITGVEKPSSVVK